MCVPIRDTIEVIPQKCVLCLSHEERFVSTSRADGAFFWTGPSTKQRIERGIRFDLMVKGVDLDQTSWMHTLASPLTVGPKQGFLAF